MTVYCKDLPKFLKTKALFGYLKEKGINANLKKKIEKPNKSINLFNVKLYICDNSSVTLIVLFFKKFT
jgi:hypothetical protein